MLRSFQRFRTSRIPLNTRLHLPAAAGNAVRLQRLAAQQHRNMSTPSGGGGGAFPGGFGGFKMPGMGQMEKGEALKQFVRVPFAVLYDLTRLTAPQSQDLTELAKTGKLDPTIGRDAGACGASCAGPLADWRVSQRSAERFRVRALKIVPERRD